MNKVMDYLWWYLSRKPENKYIRYILGLIIRLAYGFVITVGIVAVIGGIKEQISGLIICGAIILAVSIVGLLLEYIDNVRLGFIDEEHKIYLSKVKEVGKRIGKLK
jgi:hypothetical protein